MNGASPELAGVHDAAHLLRLRNEAASWQAANGVEHWREDEIPVRVYLEQIERGEWFVLRDDHRVVAGFRLLWQDLPVWGRQPPVAAYVHHLVSRRDSTPAGPGASLLSWAGTRAARGGRRLLRLDCIESNQKLRAYYRGQGFAEVGRTEFDAASGWWPVTRFERNVPGGGQRSDP